MSPLLVVIVTFGLIFVVTATLGQGFGITRESLAAPLRAHSQLNVMLLISTFIVVPAALIGLGALLPFASQAMAIVVLAMCGGAPFVPWACGRADRRSGRSRCSAARAAKRCGANVPRGAPSASDWPLAGP